MLRIFNTATLYIPCHSWWEHNLLGSKSATLLQNPSCYSVAQTLGMARRPRWKKVEAGFWPKPVLTSELHILDGETTNEQWPIKHQAVSYELCIRTKRNQLTTTNHLLLNFSDYASISSVLFLHQSLCHGLIVYRAEYFPDENCTLLGYNAASNDNFLPMIRDNLLVLCSMANNPKESPNAWRMLLHRI